MRAVLAAGLVGAGLAGPAIATERGFVAGQDGPFEVQAMITDSDDWLSYHLRPRGGFPDYAPIEVLPVGSEAKLVVHFRGAARGEDGRFAVECTIEGASPVVEPYVIVATMCATHDPKVFADDVHLAGAWVELEAKARDAGRNEIFAVTLVDQVADRRVELVLDLQYGAAQ